MVYDYYRINEEAGSLYDITDLLSVQYKGDKAMGVFLCNWDEVLGGMKTISPVEHLELMFAEQLRKSHVLQAEMAHYDWG